jgi:N6-adenosine-specific RNA methylase IME4/ParB-like chromosome segregation protein Spo0J
MGQVAGGEVMEIKEDPEIKSLFEDLSGEAYEELKRDIERRGIQVPLVVAQDGTLVCGYQRYRVAKELKVEPPIQVLRFTSKEEMLEYAFKDNILRRHLTPFQKIEASLRFFKLAKERARERMLRGTLAEKSAGVEKGRATEVIARQVGFSHDLVEMAIWLMENAPEEELEKLRSGERAISNLYKEIRRVKKVEELKKRAETLQAPEGKFDVIVVDPPWPYGTKYDPDGRRCASPYPEMSLEEIKALKLPASENCVLWLWTTNAFMHEAFHVLEAWGFEPKTILTWAKNKPGLGDWLRGQTEHCILAVKGKPVINLTNQTTLLFGEARGHSRKPEEFYRLVESLCFGRKLDYFAREKREGWEAYGTGELEERTR